MFHFLSSLFGAHPDPDDARRQAGIRAAIERAVEGTDPRLRALGGYREQLQEPVGRAVNHVLALVEAIPASGELSAAGFSHDPRVRALFCSVEHVREVLGQMREIREYGAHRTVANLYVLLLVRKLERSVLGMGLEGDALRRDVLQTAVNFTGHRCIAVAPTEADCRRELTKRGFDYLVGKALARLIEVRQGKEELARQRTLLQRKLAAMQAGGWGFAAGEALHHAGTAGVADLEREIQAIETELGPFPGAGMGLEESLGHVGAVLGDPSAWLDLRPLSLRLDHRGIRVPAAAGQAARDIVFTELFSRTGEGVIILLARIPRGEIPAGGDYLAKASRYLD